MFFFLFFASLAWAAPVPTDFQQGSATFNLKCAKCHTIGGGDRVGPDLKGVLNRHARDWIVGFIMRPGAFLDSDPEAKRLLEKYNGVRMEDTALTRAQAEGLLKYLEAAGANPPAPEKKESPREEPLESKLRMPDEGFSVSWPSFALALALLAAAAWFGQAGGFRLAAMLALAGAVSGYWSLGGRRYYHLLGNQQGYEPRQPIAFSHARHAGSLGISCLYCHYGAERSDAAAVPALNVCMNCHNTARKAASREDSAEIARLIAAWESRSPLEWVRVHQLPDYAHFSHRAHVDNNIRCQECHGPVQAMERVRQASSLSMGWCVDCHRLKPDAAPTHWKKAGGPLDCAACHW